MLQQQRLQQLKDQRQQGLMHLEQALRRGESGIELSHALSQRMDDLVRQTYRHALRKAAGVRRAYLDSLTLVALGGYGRRQLCPYSDVDLMFLYRGRDNAPVKEVIKGTFHQLWDIGLEIGHAARTPKDAIVLAARDATSMTSMLEARYLDGDRRLFEVFQKALLTHVLDKGKAGFLNDKIAERRRRIERYGDSVCVQEPHLKEGMGALRDMHYGLWIAQILVGARDLEALHDCRIVSPSEAVLLKQAIDYLLRLRFGLHFLCGKREDQLSFARQEALAKGLGFEDTEDRLAEAAMLGRYYRNAFRLKRFADSMTRIAKERLNTSSRPVSRNRIRQKPENLDAVFVVRHGEIDFQHYQPHPEQMRWYFAEAPLRMLDLLDYLWKRPLLWARPVGLALEASRDLIDEAFIGRPEVCRWLYQALRQSKGLSRVLFSMRDTGLLARFFPELKKMELLVRHDFYHRYTVDEHTFRAVAELERLRTLEAREEVSDRFSEEALAGLWQRDPKPELLNLAVLFHDAGKGYGKGHSERGAALADSVMNRLDLAVEDRSTVRFLIVNHLLMSATAFRRDVDDFKTVEDFTRQVGSLERLERLLVLTYVDVSSVSPGMMSRWKAGLLWQLFLRSRRLLLGESSAMKEDFDANRRQMIDLLSAHYSPSQITGHLAGLPAQYTLFSTPGLVGRHLAALEGYDGRAAHVSLRFLSLHEMEEDQQKQWGEETVEAIICTHDRLGLFRDLARSFHLENFHIISARLFTRTDGTVIDTVVAVNALPDSPVGPERLNLLRERLEQSLKPNLPPKAFIIQPLPEQPELSSADLGRTSFRTRIEFLNEASEDCSLIEVQAMDHPALLETLAACLTENGLDIRFARLQQQGFRVVQAFYVTDEKGGKIVNPARQGKICAFVLQYLDSTRSKRKEAGEL